MTARVSSSWLALAWLAFCGPALSQQLLRVGYVLPTDYNYIPLAQGDQIVFPATSLTASLTATIVVANRGASSASISSVAVSGGSFRVTNLPAFPVVLSAGAEFRFGVVFTPTGAGSQSGALSLGLPADTFVAQLTGTTAPPEFKLAYSFQADQNVTRVESEGVIAFPATKVNTTTTASLTLTNYGTGAGFVNGISLAGQGLKLVGLSPLPLLVAPNKALQFGIAYSPTGLESSTAVLTIDIDGKTLVVNVSASSVGPVFNYTTLTGSGASPFSPKTTLSLADTALGQTSSLTVQISNAGNAEGSIATILVSGQGFQLSNLPIFPVVLSPGATAQFRVNFTPPQPGMSNGHLQIGADAFDLVASGQAIPEITLKGPVEALEALQQPALTLTLASPYPVQLSGSLSLTVSSASFSVDPAVQFATGGRTVGFVIPANSTTAQFPTGQEIRIQTGTVAGMITATASLATTNGVDVTPAIPTSITLEIPAAAPRVLDIEIGSQNGSGFTLIITGLSTTRSLTQLELDFAPTADYRLAGSHFTFDIQLASIEWYRNSGSQAYGSLFTASIPFSWGAGSLSVGQVFQSISGTLTNEKGRSNSFVTTLQP